MSEFTPRIHVEPSFFSSFGMAFNQSGLFELRLQLLYLLRSQLLQRLLHQRAGLQCLHLLLVRGHPLHTIENSDGNALSPLVGLLPGGGLVRHVVIGLSQLVHTRLVEIVGAGPVEGHAGLEHVHQCIAFMV